MIKNYYKTLGINQNASQIEIRKAFRKLANFWHPDKNSNSIAIEKMKDLNEAYTILNDEEKRQVYDRIYKAFFIPNINLQEKNQNENTNQHFENEEVIKAKYAKDYEQLKIWISKIDFSLNSFDKIIEKSLSKIDKPIETLSYYFPVILIIIVILILISVFA